MSDSHSIKRGERLKFLRKKLGRTQVQFAKDLGITQAYVSALELGDRLLSSDLMGKLKNIYPSVDLDWLVTGLVGQSDVANSVQSTSNLVHLTDDLVHLIAVSEVNEEEVTYEPANGEASRLRRRIKRLEEFISKKFPDFPLDEI